MFSFSWNERVREKNYQVFPIIAGVHLFDDVKLQSFGKSVHKFSSWRDYVGVKVVT